jgi:hypothetical protein
VVMEEYPRVRPAGGSLFLELILLGALPSSSIASSVGSWPLGLLVGSGGAAAVDAPHPMFENGLLTTLSLSGITTDKKMFLPLSGNDRSNDLSRGKRMEKRRPEVVNRRADSREQMNESVKRWLQTVLHA